MHVTVGALLVRDGTEALLMKHLMYRITLQPGGHLEPTDRTLVGAALRELSRETGIDPGQVVPVSAHPVYVEFGRAPARPAKSESDHCHLHFGCLFTTAYADVGRLQESEVAGAAWCPLDLAERLVGAGSRGRSPPRPESGNPSTTESSRGAGREDAVAGDTGVRTFGVIPPSGGGDHEPARHRDVVWPGLGGGLGEDRHFLLVGEGALGVGEDGDGQPGRPRRWDIRCSRGRVVITLACSRPMPGQLFPSRRATSGRGVVQPVSGTS
ncbi:NUDIX domain-containing protein [Streptomyces longisporoflavus]|uniref:NUDIX domain-containing protein n=1 Tax=Streptomyces longisporoflavus TaxID=28044 RepID=A0ABW7R2L4_9ACTN